MAKVNWICIACAIAAGKSVDEGSRAIPVRQGKCDICKQKRPVSETRLWGHFTPEQLTKARKRAQTEGRDKAYIAEPDDVAKLIGVIEGTLEGLGAMSYMTRKIIKELRDKLAHEKPIDLHETKQLAYWYGKDIDMYCSRTGETDEA